MKRASRLAVLALALSLLAVDVAQAWQRPGASDASGGAGAVGVAREDVVFEIVHRLDNQQRGVFVLGDLDELGDDDVRHAVELRPVGADTWRVVIALPTGSEFSYAYYERDRRGFMLPESDNGTALTPVVSGRTRTELFDKSRKGLMVHSSLQQPLLHWRLADTDQPFRLLALEDHGPGRGAGERTWMARRFGRAGHRVEFFFSSRDGVAREPAEGTYATKLDRFFVQDGALYTYVPSASVGPPRRVGPTAMYSAVLDQQRAYRVSLPRGYDEHVDRRYPVLYLYDGQVMWDAGGSSWDPQGSRMASLVDRGTAGELIQVAVDVRPGAGCLNTLHRGLDCLPPEVLFDAGGTCGTFHGQADRFLRFIEEELKPAIDATYRTLPDREHTFASGYSFGGVYAMVAGWDHSEVFGAVAPQSASLWVPAFAPRIATEKARDVRIYLDAGTQEGNLFTAVRDMNRTLQEKGFVLHRDLAFRVGMRQVHNFPTGGRRLAHLMSFLYPATSEPAELPDLELRSGAR